MKSALILIMCYAMIACGGSSKTQDPVQPPANKTPVITLEAAKTIAGGESLTLTAHATDPDGDALTYRWQSNDASISFDNINELEPTVTFPALTNDKTYQLTLTVTDTKGASAERSIAVLSQGVILVNKSPVITMATSQVASSEQSMVFTPTVSDPESDPLTFNWSANNQAVAFSDSNKLRTSVTFPSVTQSQIIAITLTVTDAADNTTSHLLSVTVEPSPVMPETQPPTVNFVTTPAGASGDTVVIAAEVITTEVPTKTTWTFNNNSQDILTFNKLNNSHYRVEFEAVLPNVAEFSNLPVSLSVFTATQQSSVTNEFIAVSPNIAPVLTVTLDNEITIDEKQTLTVTPTINHSHKIDSIIWRWTTPSNISLINTHNKTVTLVAPELEADAQATLEVVISMGDEKVTASTQVQAKNDEDIAPITLSLSRVIAVEGHQVDISAITTEPEQIVSANWTIEGFDTITLNTSKTHLDFMVPHLLNNTVLSVVYTAKLTDGSDIIKTARISAMSEGAVRAAIDVRFSQVTPKIYNNIAYQMPIVVADSLKLIDSIAVTQPFTVNTFAPIEITRTAQFVHLNLKTNTIVVDHLDFMNLQLKVGNLTLDYPIQLSMIADE